MIIYDEGIGALKIGQSVLDSFCEHLKKNNPELYARFMQDLKRENEKN